jgi:hypothetical protein
MKNHQITMTSLSIRALPWTLRIRALGARRIQQVAIGRVSTNSSEPEAGAPKCDVNGWFIKHHNPNEPLS